MGLQNFPHLPRDNKDVAEKRSKLVGTLPPLLSSINQEIENSLRKNQLSLFKADKRLRERDGIEPNR